MSNLDELEIKLRKRLRDDYPFYARKCLKIRTKSGAIVPFILNEGQLYLDRKIEQQKREKGFIRAIILKGRQLGLSTYIQGRGYQKVTNHIGMRAFILTHDSDATNNLFEMAQRYHQYCPEEVKPGLDTSNAKELLFGGLESGYKIGTAGNKGVGRSSTIQFFHASEVAFWPNAAEHAKGILQAVPSEPGTEIFFESTANGVGNYFHEQWQLAETGQSDFIPIFIPWYWQKEYRRSVPEDFTLTDEEEELSRIYDLTAHQIMWRRYKIVELSVGGFDGSKGFMQEYPCNPVEAFQTSGEDVFIAPEIVMKARKAKAEGVGPLLIGVDPARFGDDRTSIIRRQGRKAYKLQSYTKKDTMEVVGLCHRIIVDEQPVKLFLDIGGLGPGIYDRLVELGHGDVVVAVNSGTPALDQDRYFNKRAEMWGLCKEWLQEQPAEIPDVDSLHADLCSTKYGFDSNSRLKMEPKEKLKERVRSPDEAEALILTFAMPVVATHARKAANEQVANRIMSKYKNIQRIRSQG